MRFLCVCETGDVFSAAVACALKTHYNQEAIAVGQRYCSTDTLVRLGAWADYVILMKSALIHQMPMELNGKFYVADVGPFESITTPDHPALMTGAKILADGIIDNLSPLSQLRQQTPLPGRDKILEVLRKMPRLWGVASTINRVTGLIQLCRDWIHEGDVMVEVGCFAGVSTAVFAQFAKTVFAVDPWELVVPTGYTEITEELMLNAAREFRKTAAVFSNIVPVQDFSVTAAQTFTDASLDAVYIDGEHSRKHFVQDVKAWQPKLLPTGRLMGHDFDLVHDFFPEAGISAPQNVYEDSSWVIEKGGCT